MLHRRLQKNLPEAPLFQFHVPLPPQNEHSPNLSLEARHPTSSSRIEFPVPFVDGVRIDSLAPSPHVPIGKSQMLEVHPHLETRARSSNLVRFTIGCLATFSVVLLAVTLWKDVTLESAFLSSVVAYEASLCEADYLANQCGTLNVPEMVDRCARWQACMNADASSGIKSRVIAQVFGEFIEHFVAQLSIKTLMVLTILAYFSISTISKRRT